MAQPVDFGYGEEEQHLAKQRREKFFKANNDELKLMNLVGQRLGPRTAEPECLWDRDALEADGRTGLDRILAVPEEAGGIGHECGGHGHPDRGSRPGAPLSRRRSWPRSTTQPMF